MNEVTYSSAHVIDIGMKCCLFVSAILVDVAVQWYHEMTLRISAANKNEKGEYFCRLCFRRQNEHRYLNKCFQIGGSILRFRD
jgi:hypothetical protein